MSIGCRDQAERPNKAHCRSSVQKPVFYRAPKGVLRSHQAFREVGSRGGPRSAPRSLGRLRRGRFRGWPEARRRLRGGCSGDPGEVPSSSPGILRAGPSEPSKAPPARVRRLGSQKPVFYRAPKGVLRSHQAFREVFLRGGPRQRLWAGSAGVVFGSRPGSGPRSLGRLH